MKALLSVALIAFVAQASAQTTRSLMCIDCVDCPRIEANTPRSQCYGPAPVPTRVTDPTTIGLTPPTTPIPNPQIEVQPEVQGDQIDTYISPFQANPTFQCYTVRARVGDRTITSRGCTPIHQTHDLTCRQVNQWENPEFCDLCDEDNCNTVSGVSNLLASITMVFAALFIAHRLH